MEKKSSEALIQAIAPQVIEELENERKQLDESNKEKAQLLKEVAKLKEETIRLQTSLEQVGKVLVEESKELETKDESNEDNK